MSWKNIMRRVLPPIGGVPPHITSSYGATDRPPKSTKPHEGIDFNYRVPGQRGINLGHPAIRSPATGIVINAGEGTAGRIAIRDSNGFIHEILHSHRQHVTIGDPVVAGQLIGTMGNTGVNRNEPEKGPHHVHYQLRDRAGRIVDPSAYWDQQGPIDPNPAAPAFLDEHQRYLRILEASPSASASQPAVFDTTSFPSAERTGSTLPRPSVVAGNSCLARPRPPGRSTKRDRLSSRRKTLPRAILEEKFGAWSGFQPASQTSPDTIRTLQPRYLTRFRRPAVRLPSMIASATGVLSPASARRWPPISR
jgi:hypothetical protein